MIGLSFAAGIAFEYRAAAAHRLDATTFFNGISPVRAANDRFKLVDPLIAYETPEATPLLEYASLKQKVRGIIAHATTTKIASDVSVYYRDFNSGRWIAIRRNVMYYPASLLKIPVMIAYFRRAESESSILNAKVTYKGESSENTFEAPSHLVVGRSYSIRELIEHMIVDSDNGATYTLLAKIDTGLLSEVYTDLGIKDPGGDSANYEISAKTYALFFRILYNATYLSPAASEQALEMLSRTTYKDGLVAGVPQGVEVAHKYGEHILTEGGTATGVELHDCGIVYRPSRPYLLCVMTSAKDIASATTIIASISKTIYEASEVTQ